LSAPDASRSRWSLTKELFARPYPTSAAVLVPASLFALLVPGYLVIGAYARGRALHLPALALDRALPVLPLWTLVYGSLYMAVFLPMVVVRHEEHIRRTLWAFVMVWVIGAIGWLSYPTILPRPTRAAIGEGFGAWALRIAYGMDDPYNCFPSLHVAQAFLAAFTCQLVSRRLGLATTIWATLVAGSTLFTKQHYAVDVIAGILLAGAAYLVFLRGYSRTAIPQLDERVVSVVMLGFVGLHALLIAGFWVAYLFR
jgi:membrane-associated phospholipid phosphatase